MGGIEIWETFLKLILYMLIVLVIIVSAIFLIFRKNGIKSSKQIEPIIEITTNSVNGITESDTTYTYKAYR